MEISGTARTAQTGQRVNDRKTGWGDSNADAAAAIGNQTMTGLERAQEGLRDACDDVQSIGEDMLQQLNELGDACTDTAHEVTETVKGNGIDETNHKRSSAFHDALNEADAMAHDSVVGVVHDTVHDALKARALALAGGAIHGAVQGNGRRGASVSKGIGSSSSRSVGNRTGKDVAGKRDMRIPKVKISSQVRIPCNVWIVSENIAKMLDYVEESRVC